jgi:osmotically-inducible protein OsmY
LDQRPDPDIARDAVSAIVYSVPSATNIRPIVENGWVTLEGTAEWYYQKRDAENAVRHLRGVNGLSNAIQIKPQVVPADIKHKIEEALKRNAAIDASGITVEASGGEVTLSRLRKNPVY